MNILELNKTENKANISLTVPFNDLMQLVDYCVNQGRKMEREGEKKEEYLTVKQAEELLKVSKPTLWRWAKNGYLVPSEVGGKRYYKLSDIERIMEGVK